WHEAKGVGGFRETDPREESSPAESTTVMIVYDDAAVYVGARLYDAEPARISRRLGRRDDDTQSDMFYVDFDSYHDHRTAFELPVFGSPFDRGHSYFGGAGLDVKYGVTSNLTLDAAVNPDFGQVESDPAFVNLTTVEQFLQERRPFFVEGASIFNFGGTGPYIQFGNTPQYFYSRRIGRTPSLEPEAPPGGFIDVPTHTTILGAAKLSGKTPSGWSVGVLDAVTARERASFASGSSGWHEDVEPFTNYVVGRVRREVGGHT